MSYIQCFVELLGYTRNSTFYIMAVLCEIDELYQFSF